MQEGWERRKEGGRRRKKGGEGRDKNKRRGRGEKRNEKEREREGYDTALLNSDPAEVYHESGCLGQKRL